MEKCHGSARQNKIRGPAIPPPSTNKSGLSSVDRRGCIKQGSYKTPNSTAMYKTRLTGLYRVIAKYQKINLIIYQSSSHTSPWKGSLETEGSCSITLSTGQNGLQTTLDEKLRKNRNRQDKRNTEGPSLPGSVDRESGCRLKGHGFNSGQGLVLALWLNP